MQNYYFFKKLPYTYLPYYCTFFDNEKKTLQNSVMNTLFTLFPHLTEHTKTLQNTHFFIILSIFLPYFINKIQKNFEKQKHLCTFAVGNTIKKNYDYEEKNSTRNAYAPCMHGDKCGSCF